MCEFRNSINSMHQGGIIFHILLFVEISKLSVSFQMDERSDSFSCSPMEQIIKPSSNKKVSLNCVYESDEEFEYESTFYYFKDENNPGASSSEILGLKEKSEMNFTNRDTNAQNPINETVLIDEEDQKPELQGNKIYSNDVYTVEESYEDLARRKYTSSPETDGKYKFVLLVHHNGINSMAKYWYVSTHQITREKLDSGNLKIIPQILDNKLVFTLLVAVGVIISLIMGVIFLK
ncbi:hypothetical protein MXB_1363, partial [Myxobolus squamalis]